MYLKPGILALALLLLSACAGRDLIVAPFDTDVLFDRASVQSENGITIHTTVVTPDETRAMYGIDLYKSGVQPVWLQIENSTGQRFRYAPVSTDREYFAPLEVAYVNRGGLSAEARQDMDRRFYSLAIPRIVNPGETISGIVLTHAETGTKGYNVDVFSPDQTLSFTFFVTPEGFVPDHEAVDFKSIYAESESIDTDIANLAATVSALDCCATDEAGNLSSGIPLNVMFIGTGDDVLYSLLRARWHETDVGEAREDDMEAHYYRGRKQDGIFRYAGRNESDGYYELRLWLSPVVADGAQVWVGHVRHFFSHKWSAERPDPDIDVAQDFLLQNLWYSSVLRSYGQLSASPATSLQEKKTTFAGDEYFTEGKQLVLWVSGDPISLDEVKRIDWTSGESQ